MSSQARGSWDLLAAVVVVGALLSGCTSSGPVAGSSIPPPSSTAGTPATSGPATPGTPDSPEVAAVVALLDRVSATAGGPVAAQRELLAELVDPGQREAQDQCPEATTTLSFEPVPGRARLRPDWSPPVGTLTGQVWGIPVLIRIHTGDRITGSDVAELHVVIAPDGVARLPAMCVN